MLKLSPVNSRLLKIFNIQISYYFHFAKLSLYLANSLGHDEIPCNAVPHLSQNESRFQTRAVPKQRLSKNESWSKNKSLSHNKSLSQNESLFQNESCPKQELVKKREPSSKGELSKNESRFQNESLP